MEGIHSKKAPWIVVTGMDGSGKTTLVNHLVHALPGKVFSFHIAHEAFVFPALRFLKGRSDPYTERLLFALDARLTNHRLTAWRRENDYVISDRGWVDALIYGTVEGFSYQETTAIMRLRELEQPSVIIYLTVDIDIALNRIQKEKTGRSSLTSTDQFETPEFLKKCRTQFTAFTRALKSHDRELEIFSGIPSLRLDTSSMSPPAVFHAAQTFLQSSRAIPVRHART